MSSRTEGNRESCDRANEFRNRGCDIGTSYSKREDNYVSGWTGRIRKEVWF